MQLEVQKYLFDIQRAGQLLNSFVLNKTFDDYLADRLLRSGVERQFEIIGAAASKLAKVDPACAEPIREDRKIIAFRNVLIHGYADVDDALVWDLLQSRLPALLEDVAAIRSAPDGPDTGPLIS